MAEETLNKLPITNSLGKEESEYNIYLTLFFILGFLCLVFVFAVFGVPYIVRDIDQIFVDNTNTLTNDTSEETQPTTIEVNEEDIVTDTIELVVILMVLYPVAILISSWFTAD